MKAVAAALVKAQRAFGPALKTHTNPAFKSKYADLSACIEAVIDALNANGIALVQKPVECESGVAIETLFVHESGEILSAGVLRVPAVKNDPQGYGSATTYCRRYGLMAACGIAPEDDDGNAASKPRAVQDTSPAAVARRLSVGISSGGTAGVVDFLREQDAATKKAIWSHMSEADKDAIKAAQPAKETV